MPSQSPDRNPIEHLWEEIKKRLDAKPWKNLEELKASVFELWEIIDDDVTKKLVSSMPRRCASVRDHSLFIAGGGLVRM